MKKLGNADLSLSHFLLLLKNKLVEPLRFVPASYMNTPILLCLPDSFYVLVEKPK